MASRHDRHDWGLHRTVARRDRRLRRTVPHRPDDVREPLIVCAFCDRQAWVSQWDVTADGRVICRACQKAGRGWARFRLLRGAVIRSYPPKRGGEQR